MDLKVNCVDFQGKQEILYGLKKAADNVHSYSVYMQPRLMRFGENPAIKKYETFANAYLDMVTMDSEFANAVKNFSKKDLKSVREYLKPLENNVRPIEYFQEFIQDVMRKNHTKTAENKSALQILLDKIS